MLIDNALIPGSPLKEIHLNDWLTDESRAANQITLIQLTQATKSCLPLTRGSPRRMTRVLWVDTSVETICAQPQSGRASKYLSLYEGTPKTNITRAYIISLANIVEH